MKVEDKDVYLNNYILFKNTSHILEYNYENLMLMNWQGCGRRRPCPLRRY